GFIQNGDDALLFGERRKRNLTVFDELLRNALVSDSTAHRPFTFGAEAVLRKKIIQIFVAQAFFRPEHKILARSKSYSVGQTFRDPELSILEAWCDLGQ